jgi:hypothetical protein
MTYSRIDVRRSRLIRSRKGKLYSRKPHRRSYKVGSDQYELSDVVDLAKETGSEVRTGGKHPVVLYHGKYGRPFPVAESTPDHAIHKYFRVVTELPPKEIREYLRGRKYHI